GPAAGRGVPAGPFHRVRGAPGAPPFPAGDRLRLRSEGSYGRGRHRLRGRLELRTLLQEEGLQRLAPVLDQVEAIGHLHRVGRARAGPLRVGTGPIAADDLDSGAR